jgi:hypothetical protein
VNDEERDVLVASIRDARMPLTGDTPNVMAMERTDALALCDAIDALRAELAEVHSKYKAAFGMQEAELATERAARLAAEARVRELVAHIQSACPLGWAAGAYMDEARAWELKAVELIGGDDGK